MNNKIITRTTPYKYLPKLNQIITPPREERYKLLFTKGRNFKDCVEEDLKTRFIDLRNGRIDFYFPSIDNKTCLSMGIFFICGTNNQELYNLTGTFCINDFLSFQYKVSLFIVGGINSPRLSLSRMMYLTLSRGTRPALQIPVELDPQNDIFLDLDYCQNIGINRLLLELKLLETDGTTNLVIKYFNYYEGYKTKIRSIVDTGLSFGTGTSGYLTFNNNPPFYFGPAFFWIDYSELPSYPIEKDAVFYANSGNDIFHIPKISTFFLQCEEGDGTIIKDKISGLNYGTLNAGTWRIFAAEENFVNENRGASLIANHNDGIYSYQLKFGTMISPYQNFVYSTLAEGEVELTTDKWVIMTKGSELSERYEFEVEPAGWDIEQQNLYRTFQRNLKGDLLTSIQTSKDRIVLDFSEQQYIGDYAKSILEYYFHSKQSFYLAKKFYDAIWGEYNRIWEVTFEDESLNLERMGITLNFIEI